MDAAYSLIPGHSDTEVPRDEDAWTMRHKMLARVQKTRQLPGRDHQAHLSKCFKVPRSKTWYPSILRRKDAWSSLH